MNPRTILKFRNDIAIAQWRMRAALVDHHDMMDMRTDDDRQRWRELLVRLRNARRSKFTNRGN